MGRRRPSQLIGGSWVNTSPWATQRRPQRYKDGENRLEPALQAPRLAATEALAHDEPQVEAAAMNQQALQDVRVSTEMRAPHPTGVIQVRKGTLGEFRPLPPQAAPAGAPHAATISIDGGLRVRRVGPVASAAVGFGASVIGSLAWPAMIVIVLLIFKKELLAAAPWLRELEFGSVTVRFTEELARAADAASEIEQQPAAAPPPPVTDADLMLAEHAPLLVRRRALVSSVHMNVRFSVKANGSGLRLQDPLSVSAP